MTASGAKRKAQTLLKAETKTARTEKFYPLFGAAKTSPSDFKWLSSIDGTCLHGVHKDPPALPKVALFDLDGTLIRPQGGKRHPKDANDWEWWHKKVQRYLTKAIQDGFSIFIVSNQGGFSSPKGSTRASEWKKKILHMAAQISDVPFHIFAASQYDRFRKPLPGIWEVIEALHREKGAEIDRAESFFVGDAAGRSWDHSCADRLFASNAGIRFLTPEEYFLEQKPQSFALNGFHPSLLPDPETLFSPSNSPLLPEDLGKPEIVLFVGYPSTGKSSFYNKYFAPKDYVHVNQDTLNTIVRCLNVVRSSLESGRSCVIDNTNRNKVTRAKYVDIATQFKVSIRCIHFTAPLELAIHNNIYRAYFAPLGPNEKRRNLLPAGAFHSFKSGFESPALDEGFSEVKTVNWIFEGTDEERRLWNIWTSGYS